MDNNDCENAILLGIDLFLEMEDFDDVTLAWEDEEEGKYIYIYTYWKHDPGMGR